MYYIFNWLHIVILLLANVFFWKKTQILVILQMFRPFPTTLLWPVFSITMFCLSPSAQASYLCGSSALVWLMMLSGTGFITSSGTACSNVVLLAHVEGFWSCSSKGVRPAGQKEHLIPIAPWSPKSARFRHLLSFCWRLIVCAFLLVFQGELSHHCVLPRVSWKSACWVGMCHGQRDFLEVFGAGSAGEGAALTLRGGDASGVCRVGWCSAGLVCPAWLQSVLCVWRDGHQVWWHPPHLPCSGQVLPDVSRCGVLNWANLLCVCSWSVMLLLIVWHQAGLCAVAQPVCVGSMAAALPHIPVKALCPLLSPSRVWIQPCQQHPCLHGSPQ